MSASMQFDSNPQPESDSDENFLPDEQAAQFSEGDDEVEYLPKDADLQPISLPESSRRRGESGRTDQHRSPGGASDRIVPVLKDNPYAQEPTYLTRPNRWYGADSTWLSWTEEDRLIVQSLDRTRSQDLSLHLYNAHTLETNAKQEVQSRKKHLKGKAPESTEGEPEERQMHAFKIPRRWTAWPLPPHQVPRETLVPSIGRDVVYKRPRDPLPSADLEDCIVATTTRIARERWEARAWQPEFPQKRQWGIKTEEDHDDIVMKETAVASSEGESDHVESVTSDSESASDHPDGEVFTSQAYDLGLGDDADEDRKDNKGNIDGGSSNQGPVPMADDDKARDLLLPGVRSILGKLDSLLMGLHNARHAYATKVPRKGRGLRPERDIDDATDSGVDAASVRASSQRRKRKLSVTSFESSRSETTRSEDVKETLARRGKSRPRDWSDVIGMAALTGWDSAVVERASQRCASLFGENMLFRTFHEGDKTAKRKSYFTESAAGERQDDDAEQAGHVEQAREMVRTSQACTECRRMKEKCEPQEGTEGRGICSRCARKGTACSGITVKAYTPIERSCPHQSCERHTVPFKSPAHLQRHLDSIHQHDTLRPQPPSRSPSTSIQDHPNLDAFFCPVTNCPRRQKPFARGARLYEHVRKMHPEIDVDEVKKLEVDKRGENRGRWNDERRGEIARRNSQNRSRSKSRMSSVGTDAST